MRYKLIVFLAWLLRIINPRYRSIGFVFVRDGITHKVKRMNTTLTDVQKFTLTVAEQNDAGTVFPFQSMPTWASSDDSIVTVAPAADGLSADVTTTGKDGTATITVSADGFTATDDITVTASPATKLVLTATDPVSRI